MGAAFLLGLAGSLHCVLMCGPLMLILDSSKKTAFLKHHLIYHSGRLLMYLLLGFAASMVGMGFTLAGAHQVLAIALGVLVVLVGLGQLLHQQRRFKIPSLDQFSELLLRKYNRLKSPNVFIKGAVNGLLPCGLVYVALAGAVMTKSAVEGVFYMLAFGLGTTPLLLFIIFFGPLQQKIRGLAFQKALPWVTLIFGLWILIRGLGLGIPFWSPKPEMMNVQTEMHQH